MLVNGVGQTKLYTSELNFRIKTGLFVQNDLFEMTQTDNTNQHRTNNEMPTVAVLRSFVILKYRHFYFLESVKITWTSMEIE